MWLFWEGKKKFGANDQLKGKRKENRGKNCEKIEDMNFQFLIIEENKNRCFDIENKSLFSKDKWITESSTMAGTWKTRARVNSRLQSQFGFLFTINSIVVDCGFSFYGKYLGIELKLKKKDGTNWKKEWIARKPSIFDDKVNVIQVHKITVIVKNTK